MKNRVLKNIMTLCVWILLFTASCSKAEEKPIQEKGKPIGFEQMDLSTLATQWDDGWISRIRYNWMEIEKRKLRVYLF